MSVDFDEYAQKNKLDPVWSKLPAVMDAFKKYPESEWVWWLDIDAMILTPQFDVYSQVLENSAMKGLLQENSSLGFGTLPQSQRPNVVTGSVSDPVRTN
jgi:hypothetical protein